MAKSNRYKEKQKKEQIKTYIIITCVFIALIVPFVLIGFYGLKTAAGFNYSTGIDKNGFWKGIKARDYVEAFDYNAFPIPAETHQISEERLESEIGNILSSYSTSINLKDRPVEFGDTVNIDYVGSVDGVEFDGGSTGGAGAEVTIGVTSYIDDFLEQLVGHMPGETFDVNVTFPEEYHEPSLENKDAVFVTTINHIVEKQSPELTDEFVSGNLYENYKWSTVQEMRDSLLSNLRSDAISQYIQTYCTKELNIKSVPEKLIEHQANVMLKNYQSYASYNNMSVSDFLAQNLGVQSEEEFVDVYHDAIVNSATFNLVLQYVAESAGMRVSDEELKEFFGVHSEDDGHDHGDEGAQAEATDLSLYEKVYGKPYMKQLALLQKAYNYMVDNVVLL